MGVKVKQLLLVFFLLGGNILFAQDGAVTNAFDDLARRGEMKMKEEAMFVPATEEEIVHKFLFFKEMLEKMGVPIIDDELVEIVKVRLNQISNL